MKHLVPFLLLLTLLVLSICALRSEFPIDRRPAVVWAAVPGHPHQRALMVNGVVAGTYDWDADTWQTPDGAATPLFGWKLQAAVPATP